MIDANELKELYEDYEGLKVPYEVVLQNIDDMPTAYDIDKVVEKLKERASQSCAVLFAAGIEEAISIIKAGEQE